MDFFEKTIVLVIIFLVVTVFIQMGRIYGLEKEQEVLLRLLISMTITQATDDKLSPKEQGDRYEKILKHMQRVKEDTYDE